MRVRLYCLGDPWIGQILWLDSFPVALRRDPSGTMMVDGEDLEDGLCILDEQHGNVVLVRHADSSPAQVNSAPVQRGGLAPGDVLTVCDRQFLVSYERTTSHPLPPPRFEITVGATSASEETPHPMVSNGTTV